MKRSGPLVRRTPIRARRNKPRRGEPTAAEKTAIRDQVYEETGGMCLLRLMPKHQSGVLPKDGSVFVRWHLVHLKAKRRFGWDRENLTGGCYECHIVGMHTKGLKG